MAGEAAGYAMGLVMLGSASARTVEVLNFCHDTQHEKIIRGCAVGLAFIFYGREEEADAMIEQLSMVRFRNKKKKKPRLTFGFCLGNFTIRFEFIGIFFSFFFLFFFSLFFLSFFSLFFFSFFFLFFFFKYMVETYFSKKFKKKKPKSETSF